MPASTDPRLLEPLVLTGTAVDRDALIREKNNAPAPDEAAWLATAHAQNDEISAAEVSFFEQLESRIN